MYKKVKRRGKSSPRKKVFKKKFKDVFWSSKNSYRHKLDYARKREFITARSKRKRIPLKKKIELVILLVFVALFFAVVATHPFFSIKNLNIEGLNRIDKEEFTQATYSVLNCKKLFVFSCGSYIFVDVDEVRDVLFDKYSLDSISIKKVFPNTMNIKLEEKISTVIYDDGKTYSFMDLFGNFVETIANVSEDEWRVETETVSTTTGVTEDVVIDRTHIPNSKRIYAEVGNYPLVYDDRSEKPQGEEILKPEYVGSLIDWYNYFNKNLEENVDYFRIINSVGDTYIDTYSGWQAVVRLGERFESQAEQLDYILNKEINGRYFNYIELRYPDRAYWK